MRILIIRHGHPDYANDTLTEKGWAEAEALSERLVKENIDDIYCSPLGRAKATAKPTLEKLGKEAEILDWLAEFRIGVKIPNEESHAPWNMRPQYWTNEELMFDNKKWREHEIYNNETFLGYYDTIKENWDKLMAKYGYIRDGQIYHFDENTDQSKTIALFCHLGLGLALTSTITGLSLPMLWHTFFLPTSSVTMITTEKHIPDKNDAIMRFVCVGDTSHLFAKGMEISSSGLHSPIIQ